MRIPYLLTVYRFVMLFFCQLLNGIPYDKVHVELGHAGKNPDLVAINRNSTLSGMTTDSKCLKAQPFCATLLPNTVPLITDWCPSDVKSRAKVDEALAWFPRNHVPCKVTQYWLGGLDVYNYNGHPNMEHWVKSCQDSLSPHFETLHQPVFDIRKSGILAVQLYL